MKVAIYCRLSKDDEVRKKLSAKNESESIQNQKSILIQYAIDRGYDIHDIYVDEDYSGADRDRPAFNRLIEDASQHKFDIVLAKSQSRFTRDMELVEKYLHGKFMEWGIRFIAVVDHADTDDVGNKKSRQINGLVNEWYLEDLSSNVRTVLTHKRKAGQYIGSFALYGYQKDPTDHNHLIVDPEAAEVVRKIFAMALDGFGVPKIVRTLNEAGIPNPTSYKHSHGMAFYNSNPSQVPDIWTPVTVHAMRCQRNSRDPRICTPNRIPVTDLEAIVLDKLQQHLAELLDIDRLALFVQKSDKTSSKKRQSLHQTRHEVINLEQKIKALYLKRADGTLSIDEFNSQTKKLLQQKQLLEENASKLSQKAAFPDFEKTKQQLFPYLVADCLTKDMTDALIDHVTVWPLEANGDADNTRKIEITWKY